MDLAPNIAFGDLSQSSIAEVMAAGFRAFATGTVVIEQGRGESRLFLRYGIPCGAALFVGFKPFGEYLVEHGIISGADLDRLLKRVNAEQRKLGELLVEDRVLSADRAIKLVVAHHQVALNTLCALREGKYELRGWERPPDWTEPLALDPLLTLTRTLSTEELFDRRVAIMDRVGRRKLRLADDFDDQAARISLTATESDALARLHVPRPASELIAALKRDDAEAFVAALALLGLVDSDDPEVASVPRRVTATFEPVFADNTLLRPLEPTIPPGQTRVLSRVETPGRRSDILEDATAFLRPAEPTVPPLSARSLSTGRGQTGRGSTPRPDLTESELSEIGLGPAEAFDLVENTRPAQEPPGATIHRGEIEFSSSDGSDPPLELDLNRASPRMRERLEPSLSSFRRPTSSTTRPPLSQVGPARRSNSPSTAISVIGQKGASRPEYNPFAVHFRGAPAAQALDERLERALRDAEPELPTSTQIERPAPARRRPAPPSDRSIELEATMSRMLTDTPGPRAPRPVRPHEDPNPSQILADIADVVGDLPETNQPLSMPETDRPKADDDLAILAARENVAQPEDLVSTDSSPGTAEIVDDPSIPPELSGEEVSMDEPLGDMEPEARHAEETSSPVEEKSSPVEKETVSGPVTTRPAADGDGVRRRLLARGMRNVAGGLLNLKPKAPASSGVRSPDTPAARPATADAELERDVAQRISRLLSQDHFTRLDLERAASTEQVKEAFLSLAKRYHPDRITALGQNHLLPQVRELFSRIKESYDVLVDPASRARYANELSEKEGGGKKTSPEEAKAAFLKGTHFLKKRDFANAEAEFVRAKSGDPQGEYLTELAFTLFQNPARRDDARQEIRDLIAQALKSGTETDRTYVVAAYVARSDGENDKAEKLFRKTVERNPKNIDAARELRLIESRRTTEPSGGSAGLFDKLRAKKGPKKS